MDTIIRPVTREALPECLHVIHQSFRTVAEEFGLTRDNCPKHTSFLPLIYLETQMDWGWHMFALYADGDMVGYASVSQEADGICELHNLAVLPAYRHRGFGKQLLDHAKALSPRQLRLGIIEEHTVLKSWYIQNGFESIGTRKFDHLPFTSGYLLWTADQKG